MIPKFRAKVEQHLRLLARYPRRARHLVVEVAPDVYAFDLMPPSFCKRLLRHTDRFESSAPNTMNRYGKVLREMGLDDLEFALRDRLVRPLARALFGYRRGYVRRHGPLHGFLVEYSPETQRSLAWHEDASKVTLNVCLGREFAGGDLRIRVSPEVHILVPQKIGRAVLHLGTVEHRAEPTTSGRRTNLVLWCGIAR